MAERKNMDFDRPGGYATPRGAIAVQRDAAAELASLGEDAVRMLGDRVPQHQPLTPPPGGLAPAHQADDPDTRLYVGDCRDVLPALPDRGAVDLVFADPPFNWDVPYEQWNDGMPRDAF